MAVEMFHGFDNCNNTTDLGRFGWAAVSGGGMTTGRWGSPTRAFFFNPQTAESENNSQRAYHTFSGPLSRIIGGVSIRTTMSGNPPNMDGLPDVKNRLIKFMDGAADTNANVQIGIGIGPGGTIRVWRGDTLIFTSAPTAFRITEYQRLEWDLVIHNSAGSLVLRMDGVTIPGMTGIVNTQNTANASATALRVNTLGTGGLIGPVVELDDYLCMNGTDDGTNMHSMKGDVRCDLLAPTADFQRQFASSTGITNWSLIDEWLLNSADFVLGTSGQEDIYDLADIGSLSFVHAIQVNVQAWRNGTTLYDVTPRLYTNSAQADLPPITLTGTTGMHQRRQVLNPITGTAWTPAEISAMRLGLPVT